MALVYLSSEAAFFDGDAKLMTSTVPMISIVSPTFCSTKSPVMSLLWVRTHDRHDLSGPGEFQLFCLGPDQALPYQMSAEEFKTKTDTKERT